MTTVAILPVLPPGKTVRRYEAVAGQRRAEGAAIGGALDAITSQMADDEAPGMVVVQTMEADASFTEAQRGRVQELMEQWRRDRDADRLPCGAHAELEQLVDEELEGTIVRSRALTGRGA